MPDYRTPYPHPRKKTSGRGKLILVVVIVVIIAVVGIVWRMHASHKLKSDTEASAVLNVAVIKTAHGAPLEEIVLPGNVVAWHEANLYAQTSGYLKSWIRSMGMVVKQGELIATIETPAVDAQLHQAQANLKTAQANNILAQSTAQRWKKLLKTDSVSKQEAEEKISAAQAQGATVAAAQAEVDRLNQLEGFKEIRAPFSGLITSRTTDLGSLITAGIDSPQPLFHLVQADHLRIYVRVPQNYSSQMHAGVNADLILAEHPNQVFHATYRTSAEAIDPASRTLLTEFQYDNSKGDLLPGGYTEVHIKLPTRDTSMRLPVNTLLFRAEGTQVAVVDADNKAQLRKVTIGRDFGNSVEIVDGLNVDENVIVNPADSLISGQPVHIAPVEVPKDSAAKNEAGAATSDKEKAKEDAKGSDKKDKSKDAKKQ